MKTHYDIDKKRLEELIRKAASIGSRDGKEICGLLLASGSRVHPLQLRNKSKRGGSFCFCSSEVGAVRQAAKKLQMEIVGTFHSHPCAAAKPGQSDIEGTPDGALMLVIDCGEKYAKLWRISKGRAISQRYFQR